MLVRYMQGALRQATFTQIEDGTFIGEIPGFEGVWSNATTMDGARAELADVLEGWILLGLRMGHELPVVDGISLTPKLEVA
ncbi:MAG: type II toxin-antitoxin system HicB family antitoxin [Ktedonobacteraceae bacterium]|nr:type II toxin-antitoxin system HicB family antitoxin [Ktedonobacteraceae bacterium]